MVTPIQSTSQLFIEVHEVADNLLLTKDGTVTIILTVNAMNFSLLAEEEQDGVIYAYAALLNSLNYPIQVLISSQTKDVTSYLRLLEEQEGKAFNRTNKERIFRYRQFVANLIQERNVLDKKFYVAIPATGVELGITTAQSLLPGTTQVDINSVDKHYVFEKARSILEPKAEHLIAQFSRIGLFSRQLSTQEIIQLFYISYNPEAAEGQQITDSSQYTTPLVSSSVEMPGLNNAYNEELPAAQPQTEQFSDQYNDQVQIEQPPT